MKKKDSYTKENCTVSMSSFTTDPRYANVECYNTATVSQMLGITYTRLYKHMNKVDHFVVGGRHNLFSAAHVEKAKQYFKALDEKNALRQPTKADLVYQAQKAKNDELQAKLNKYWEKYGEVS